MSDQPREADEAAVVVPTGAERAEQERARAEQLLALLHQHGIEPPQ